MAKAFVQNIWEAGLNHASRLQKCEEVCSAKDEESQPGASSLQNRSTPCFSRQIACR